MSLRQELAAILMDHSEEMSEQTYMTILNKLAKIPDHKDPIGAADLQKQLDEERHARELVEESNELFAEQLQESAEYIENAHRILLAIMKSDPTFEDNECVVYHKYNIGGTPSWNRSHRAIALTRLSTQESHSIYARYLENATYTDTQNIDMVEDNVRIQNQVGQRAIDDDRDVLIPTQVNRRLDFDDIDPNEDHSTLPPLKINDLSHETTEPCICECCLRHEEEARRRIMLYIVINVYNKSTNNAAAKELLHEDAGWIEPIRSSYKSRHDTRFNRFLRQHFQYTLIHHTPHLSTTKHSCSLFLNISRL